MQQQEYLLKKQAQLQNEIDKVNKAIVESAEGKRPSKRIVINISDDDEEQPESKDINMGGDDDNDGNGKKSKNQFKQYKAELIPAMYYKPTLAQELRDKQIKKKMNKKKGHNLNSITGEHYEEEKKGEV